ncbi:hypothetical protein ABZ897_50730 [Nonomuraea sp. NPDC046802]|uniref:hypothetical protein n=1 Tax=Nonomuraea sp. NPDC046802 TaxID=3154919 RepID=UPI003403FF0B
MHGPYRREDGWPVRSRWRKGRVSSSAAGYSALGLYGPPIRLGQRQPGVAHEPEAVTHTVSVRAAHTPADQEV